MDEQEAEIGRLVADLAVVRRDWQSDVGTLTANLNTAEARARAMELERDAARAEAARLREGIDKLKVVTRIRGVVTIWISEDDWSALRGPAQSEKGE